MLRANLANGDTVASVNSTGFPGRLKQEPISILALGVAGFRFRSEVVVDEFESHRALRDYDVVLIDVLPFVTKFVDLRRPLNEAEKNFLLGTFTRRSSELVEYLALGRLAIVTANSDPGLVARSIIVERLSLEHPYLGMSSGFAKSDGYVFDIQPTGPLGELLRAISKQMEYRARIVKVIGSVVMRAPGGVPVGCAGYTKEGGTVVVGPAFRATEYNESELVFAFRDYLASTKSASQKVELPEWTKSWSIPGESEALQLEQQLETAITDLQQQLETARAERFAIQSRKHIFASKGDPLMEAARDALVRLGLAVQSGPDGRDDLIATAEDGRVFVVEVKGRDNKSAAESDSAQLQKWVSGYHEREGKEPKGLLVLNGYSEQDLRKRPEDVFPNQMLDYACRMRHCLISGIQLLCLAESSTANRVSAIDSLFNTSGIFPHFRSRSEWETFVIPSEPMQPTNNSRTAS
jgi:hypothetical protein